MNANARHLSRNARLLGFLRDQVDDDVVKRSVDYLGGVSFRKCSVTQILASVEGRDDYDVRLDRGGEHLEFACTCPVFHDLTDVCKHVWAALVAGVDRGFLADAPASAEIFFVPKGYDEVVWPDEARRASGPGNQKLRPWERTLLAWLDRARPGTAGTARAARSLRLSFAVALTGPFHKQSAGILRDQKGVILDLHLDEVLANGTTRRIGAERTLRCDAMQRLPPEEAEALSVLCGAGESVRYFAQSEWERLPERLCLPARSAASVLPDLCRRGMIFAPEGTGGSRRAASGPSPAGAPAAPLAWDDGGAWDLVFSFTPRSEGRLSLIPLLRRGDASMPWSDILLATTDGLLLSKSHLGLVTLRGAPPILAMLHEGGGLTVDASDVARLADRLLAFPDLPPIELPARSGMTVKADAPVAEAHVRGKPGPQGYDVDVSFDYGGRRAGVEESGSGWCEGEPPVLIRRNSEFEAAARTKLSELGFRRPSIDLALVIGAKKLPRALRELIATGWRVSADGKLFRQAGSWNLSVSSGVDWFDLEGGVDFGGEIVPLPRLLSAVRKGQSTIVLGDGSIGMLPEDWLKKHGGLAALGQVDGDRVRFSRGQAGILDALLAARPEIECDAAFARVRERLRTFEKIEPAVEPASFEGKLRPYQREGLAWLRFLEEFGFGGCLADDMGLGKTVEVLAYLLARKRSGPVMVVCPRSLVFNWKSEAARFAPRLRVLDHTGPGRLHPGPHFAEHDLVLATYGILRKDAPALAQVPFDLVILDESQAIKNRDTESAKAARLLSARHRLALSGTPIENRLSEVGSLFEFLNPGFLGSSSAFEGLASAGDPAAILSLARALKPFILRRTKEQVVKDLPSKTEQTISCDLEGPHRKLYDELRDHYRASLLGKLDGNGLKRAKIQVLEALLRLRQAACHPGLIDKARRSESSPKLDLLLARLDEITSDGHKALVFSQFTSLLSIVRKHLDDRAIPHAYLDGDTRDRESVVKRFRTTSCPLFLISLKAGGLGLNLVEADYVFLLDPWWNPAVEAQAIDRTHRIGQTRPVFAYRLIARDTVEEKVLALQSKKRALANLIIQADESLIRSLSRDDLEFLLS